MKITLLAVSSLDGFITRGEDPEIYTWTSPEDQAFFFDQIKKAKVIIMGRKTYESARSVMRLTPATLRIVLTSHSEKFSHEEVPGQLEFSSERVEELVARLAEDGQREALVAGGGEVNGAFLKAGLITDIFLTVEPLLFGKGRGLFSYPGFQKLTLISFKRLNVQGTLLFYFKKGV